MKKLMQQLTLAALAALTVSFTAMPVQGQSIPVPMPTAEKPLADLSITYSALHMNSPVGGCGCFWLNGGSAEVAFPIQHGIAVVGELSGEHADNIPGLQAIGLNLISGMGGIRAGHETHRLYYPFAQGLLGAVHAFDSSFPTTPPKGSANSVALAIGGGLDVAVRKHFLVRPIQAEYQFMHLPNNASNQQHDLRLSAGIVFRFYH